MNLTLTSLRTSLMVKLLTPLAKMSLNRAFIRTAPASLSIFICSINNGSSGGTFISGSPLPKNGFKWLKDRFTHWFICGSLRWHGKMYFAVQIKKKEKQIQLISEFLHNVWWTNVCFIKNNLNKVKLKQKM